MKKLLAIITLTFAGFVLSTGAASASVYSDMRGENPCLFGLVNLQSHGFSQTNTYTTEQIHQLLKASDIEAHNVETLVPGQSYQLAYSCYVDHYLAHANLQAVPVHGGSRVVTNIFWTATKPV